ncbi:unnamed protein product, partial [Discosporangium mesarthrocarpum]
VGSGVVRFGRALGYASIVGADYKLSLRKLDKTSPQYKERLSRVHKRAAQRLLHVCIKHGGVYTKFGQHISSMNHVMPREFTETLKVLQDRNPSVGVEDVARAIRSELGGELEELFTQFDAHAIAAASLAQVFTLKGGRGTGQI